MAKFLVTTSKGLENLLEQELTSFGISEIKLSVSCVWIEASLEQAYRICYMSRLANRVLLELAVGPCKDKKDLYAITQQVDWPMQFKDSASLSVDFNGVTQTLRNTQFSAQVVKDAIVDQFNDEIGRRPDVSRQNADIKIQGRLIKQQAHIFIDLSGQSLHQRGYRIDAGRAPLKENLAAAVVMRSGWLDDPNVPLVDYFCGSGTLLIEAAQMARKIPAQRERRSWGFDKWLGHNHKQFSAIKDEYDSLIESDKPLKIFGFDNNHHELKTARQNAMDALVDDCIHFETADARYKLLGLKSENGQVISNPPYGERLADQIETANLYLDFAQNIKRQHGGWRLTLITSSVDQLRLLKLQADKKYKVRNATLDCVIANYQIEATDDQKVREGIATEFQNRLKKNFKQVSKLARKADTDCYRVYDADLPNYNVAIDIYQDHLVIQEYAAPKNIALEKTQARLQDVLITAPWVLDMDPNKVSLKVRQRQKGSQQYTKRDERGEFIVVNENKAQFYVNLYDYLDTGLFLDHRDMRALIQKESQDKKVLNLFSYTCSVSVHAVLGGATQVTSVDLSKKYLEWGERNFELNNIKTAWHQFVAMDGIEYLRRNREKFDLIFIDPPSFSNSKKLDHDFDVQRDHLAMLEMAKKQLNPGGTIYFSNNLRSFKLDEAGLAEAGLVAKDLSKQTLPFDFKRRANIRQVFKLSEKTA
ncbi:bifunctional 23S rRNA (guanine(2069)-N(7))-methyltransferase RlmK/23S rRNA (guanine(2445)-N(2))-methyltransferase RlmL [Gayadomonas joobiniege]|uniref:bifunctional 23S rRNA (guanine(2069)-N(7))-methyltransferase RlmK/23S rRNA (guanine(2445)-N(2))-methyltransferase RlmL n=1 Tax=Gayadomonas joobiniege TaxID=1234606 RepID=UPI000375B6BB|nr:bifunctional 23S rRNA (guanine(2069)-N(7))-methyltransferase RlmK/23S rRNA (guanine(2445)-N(2))-methyltransferase RlmL [Gayadomonas joobiniege]